jgi:hypothetical protein
MSADGVQVETPPIAEAEFVCQARVPGGICGATERHPANPTNQCVRGHFIVGSQQRLTHGARAFERHGTKALPDPLRQTVEEFREAVITDRGGASELSTLEAAYIRRLAEVETVARLLAADLASRGLTTAKGRVRSTYSRWLEAVDRWDRLAQRVGTDRKARGLSLTERLAAAPPITLETEDRDAEGE